MPVKSARQWGLMAEAAHGAITGKVPTSVAKEFVAKTPAKKRKKFAKELAKGRK